MDLYIDFGKNENSNMTTYSIIGGGRITKYETDEMLEALEFICNTAKDLDVDTVYIDGSGMGVLLIIGLEIRGLNVKKAETCRQGVTTNKTRTSSAIESNKRVVINRDDLYTTITATISNKTSKKLKGICLSEGGDISFEDVDGTYYQLLAKDVDTIIIKELD